jgi:hypothetical protein
VSGRLDLPLLALKMENGGSDPRSIQVFSPRAAINRHHKVGVLKQQKSILSQFYRPEV